MLLQRQKAFDELSKRRRMGFVLSAFQYGLLQFFSIPGFVDAWLPQPSELPISHPQLETFLH